MNEEMKNSTENKNSVEPLLLGAIIIISISPNSIRKKSLLLAFYYLILD